MEFKSTLERKMKEHEELMDSAMKAGYEEPAMVKEVFNAIKDSKALLTAHSRTKEIVYLIQPSVTSPDLKIASDMQLAMASELILNLIKEDVINLNKKEEIKSENKTKTAKEYGDLFCSIMNKDEKMITFVNNELADCIKEGFKKFTVALESEDKKAGSQAIDFVRKEIMSLMPFVYGKARIKENSM